MKTNKESSAREGRLPFFLRPLRILSHALWTPEADERRFLVGLPITLILILFLWKQGIAPLGGYIIPAGVALWCLAYVIRFRRRLKDRGELKRVIIAPAAFIALLMSVMFY